VDAYVEALQQLLKNLATAIQKTTVEVNARIVEEIKHPKTSRMC
jgi:hypothetical protein